MPAMKVQQLGYGMMNLEEKDSSYKFSINTKEETDHRHSPPNGNQQRPGAGQVQARYRPG